MTRSVLVIASAPQTVTSAIKIVSLYDLPGLRHYWPAARRARQARTHVLHVASAGSNPVSTWRIGLPHSVCPDAPAIPPCRALLLMCMSLPSRMKTLR